MREDRLHSAESAAALLCVRPSTIRWWWSIGKLPRRKIGRLTRVRESEVLALIEKQKARPYNRERLLRNRRTLPPLREDAGREELLSGMLPGSARE